MFPNKGNTKGVEKTSPQRTEVDACVCDMCENSFSELKVDKNDYTTYFNIEIAVFVVGVISVNLCVNTNTEPG